jgi:hypothetical protein
MTTASTLPLYDAHHRVLEAADQHRLWISGSWRGAGVAVPAICGSYAGAAETNRVSKYGRPPPLPGASGKRSGTVPTLLHGASHSPASLR